MTEEARFQNEMRNALVDDCLLFRANVGQAWAGSRVERLSGGRVMIHDARPFNTGLPPGFSDTFGLVPVFITPDMIGMTVGVFLAIECKSARGRPSEKQTAFIDAINNNGGRAGAARTIDEARGIVHASRGVSAPQGADRARNREPTEAPQAVDADAAAPPARRPHHRRR